MHIWGSVLEEREVCCAERVYACLEILVLCKCNSGSQTIYYLFTNALSTHLAVAQ